MALFDISGITRGVSKLGNAVVMTVQPVANIIEIASESSSAWTLSHAADLAAKTERQAKVREQVNADLLRKALTSAQRAHLDTNEYEREVQSMVDIDEFKTKIHNARRRMVHSIDAKLIETLARKENLTDADILRAVKVGYQAPTPKKDAEVVAPSAFDISEFQSQPLATANH